MTRNFPHLGYDPTPGDVERTRALARQLGDLHGELTTTVSELHRLDTGAWKGEAAKAFIAHVDHDVTPLLKKAHNSFGRASDALARWADQLHGFQTEADALEREAATKQATLAHANTAAGLPTDTSTPHPMPEASPDPDPVAAADAKKKQQAVTDAGHALDGVRHRADELHHRFTQAAQAISHDLDKAGNIAPNKPGLFHRLAHSVEGTWSDTVKWVEDHADTIKMLGDILSAITGVLAAIAIFTAPFEPVGAIFAVAALTAGFAALATHAVAKAAGADVSWMTLGFDALGVLPGISGFTKGAKVTGITALDELGRAGNLADRVAQSGGKLYAAAKSTKTFVLFGKKAPHVFIRGEGIIGRTRAGIEGAIQFERDNQVAGTKVINAFKQKPFEAMSKAARSIDSGIKVATHAATAPKELTKDFKTFDKEHPEAVQDIKTAATIFGKAAAEFPRLYIPVVRYP